ncbi:MAG: carbohydrate ABC transporter permease [Theionarchaea archaeon]|nr:carbohydrate ABC transporter permease [Theionarchaea archaeon]
MRKYAILLTILVIFFAVLMISPVYFMFKISISQPQDIFTQHPTFFIYNTTTEWWDWIFSSNEVWPPFFKSLEVATLTALFSLAIAVPGSYAISRLPTKVKYPLVLGLFFTRMFPEVGIALPISVNFISWGLLDSVLGLVIAHMIRILPLVTWILVGTFETVPRVLEEASSIDGCSRLGTLRRVVIPLAAPGIAVGTIFAWLGSWEEFTYAVYLTLAKRTLPLQVFYYINRGNWFLTATYATLTAIPVIIITYAMQKYLRAGYMAGAVKG